MLERRTWDVQVAAADVVDSFVVNQERAVTVLNRTVGGEDGVVGLNDSSANSGSRVDGKFKLRLLAVVGGKTLKQEGTKSRSSSSAKGVEYQETLKGRAVILEIL